MKIIANFIASVLFNKKTSKKVQKEVRAFRESYQKVKYCFESVVNYDIN